MSRSKRSSHTAWYTIGRLGRTLFINSTSASAGVVTLFISSIYTGSLLMYLSSIAWLLLMLFFRGRIRRAARALVAANKGAVCWQCWYPLAKIESDRCPECGTEFDRDDLQLRWTKALYRPTTR